MKTIKEQIQDLLNSVENPKDRSKKFYLIKKNSEWYNDLLDKTSFLDFKNVNIATRLYYYLHDKTEIKKCECCGNLIRRNCDIDGKNLVYCSRKCSAVGGVDKTKITKTERYGSSGYMNPEKVRETWKKKSKEELDKISEKHRLTYSGFSGWLLGAYNCNKNYRGFDFNELHVKESNAIISYLHKENMLHVSVKDLLTTEPHEYKETTLFTCPPYGNKEHWNNNEVIKSCDDWIDECINRYICDYYLFVVDKTTKYHYNIVETIINKSHFGSNNEYVVLIKK